MSDSPPMDESDDGHLRLLQIGRGGGILPYNPLWQGSGKLELQNFGLQG